MNNIRKEIRPLSVRSENQVKIIFAICILISHFELEPPYVIISALNYLPVAGFFFFSGYGLEKSCQNQLSEGRKYRFHIIRSILKLLLPFYICQIIWLFRHDGGLKLA